MADAGRLGEGSGKAAAHPAGERGWTGGRRQVIPLTCCGITGPVEPHFLDTCLPKTLLESSTVMSCPEATEDVFNLELNIIGAVGLVAVIMIFSMIFSLFLCASRQNRELL